MNGTVELREVFAGLGPRLKVDFSLGFHHCETKISSGLTRAFTAVPCPPKHKRQVHFQHFLRGGRSQPLPWRDGRRSAKIWNQAWTLFTCLWGGAFAVSHLGTTAAAPAAFWTTFVHDLNLLRQYCEQWSRISCIFQGLSQSVASLTLGSPIEGLQDLYRVWCQRNWLIVVEVGSGCLLWHVKQAEHLPQRRSCFRFGLKRLLKDGGQLEDSPPWASGWCHREPEPWLGEAYPAVSSPGGWSSFQVGAQSLKRSLWGG